jgi:2'-5' RNA ligase
MKRIFVAIDISDAARQRAAAHIENLRRAFPRLRVGWERPEKLHLTVKFLGDVDETKLVMLDDAVRRTAQHVPAFALRIGGCGTFPANKRARVLWLGVEGLDGGFQRLHEVLESESAKPGFARETRDLKPHLTIARLREPESSAPLVERHLRTQFEPVEFEAGEIVIYESRLQPAGSVYSPIARYELAT